MRGFSMVRFSGSFAALKGPTGSCARDRFRLAWDLDS